MHSPFGCQKGGSGRDTAISCDLPSSGYPPSMLLPASIANAHFRLVWVSSAIHMLRLQAPHIQLERWGSPDDSEWTLRWAPSWSVQVATGSSLKHPILAHARMHTYTHRALSCSVICSAWSSLPITPPAPHARASRPQPIPTASGRPRASLPPRPTPS